MEGQDCFNINKPHIVFELRVLWRFSDVMMHDVVFLRRDSTVVASLQKRLPAWLTVVWHGDHSPHAFPYVIVCCLSGHLFCVMSHDHMV